MGDRYTIIRECPYCKKETEGYYADSCNLTSSTCEYCNRVFNIVMDFKFVKENNNEKYDTCK